MKPAALCGERPAFRGHFRVSPGRMFCPPPGLKVIWLHRNPSSPLSSLALRTSSDTRRTELRRAARSPLGTSKRTKYSRWGLPARGLWAGRVSKWWILASNVFGSKSRKKGGEGEETNGEGAMERNDEGWREVGINGEKERREGAAERLRETEREQWRGWSRDGER